jgi:ABC-type sugar transport system ATPase subunit
MPLLELERITKRYEGVPALGDVDLAVEPGEVVGLVGENGAGKSTLIKVVAGAVRPDEGEIRIDGNVVRFTQPAHAIHAGIAVIYQELSLCADLDATENVLLGALPTRGPLVDWPAARREAARWVRRLSPTLPMDVPVRQLPVGPRQLVEIARSLARRARLIFMDEPTAALSEREAKRLLEIIRELKRGGVSVVFVTHRLEEALDISERIVVLRDGRNAGTLERGTATREKLVRIMVGRELGTVEARGEQAAKGRQALEARGLAIDGRLGGISFTVSAGEVLGLAGLVGAGRSTLLRALFGAERLTAGRLFLDGQPVRVRRPLDAMRLGMALVPEDRRGQALLPALSTAENLAAASWTELARAGFLADRDVRAMAERQVKALDIRLRSVRQRVLALSGGNQQKVVVGRWLSRRPSVLLLDEPTRGIDVGAKAEIYELVRRLAADGVAIVISTSELPELLALADRILVLRDGRLVGELPAGVSQEQVMQLATGGKEAAA